MEIVLSTWESEPIDVRGVEGGPVLFSFSSDPPPHLLFHLDDVIAKYNAAVTTGEPFDAEPLWPVAAEITGQPEKELRALGLTKVIVVLGFLRGQLVGRMSKAQENGHTSGPSESPATSGEQ